MVLTPKQVIELNEIIDKYVSKFIAQNVNHKFLTEAEKKILTKAGINWSTITPTVTNAFRYGILSSALGDIRANKLDYEQFKKFVKNKQFMPLDAREMRALQTLETQAYNEIKGLGNKIKTGMSNITVEADKKLRKQYEATIKDKAKEAVLNRKGIKELSSDIGHAMGDWSRDLDRMSDYILHEAHDQGRAYGIMRHTGNSDPKVWKRVLDQACAHCTRLYLTGGPGTEPKIFKLSELLSNGNNIGVKAANWKPVIGPTHPWCRCQLEYYEEGAEWDASRSTFVFTGKQLTGRAKSIYDKLKKTKAIKS